MGVPAERRRYTIQEYLQHEEKAIDRHEFHDGEILAMSGGTYGHSRINTQLIRSLGNKLEGKRCQPLDSNMRVRIPRRANYIYPDISVVCGQPQFDPDDPKKTTIINPKLIVEVLSESTEAYSRGAKFDLYQQIPALAGRCKTLYPKNSFVIRDLCGSDFPGFGDHTQAKMNTFLKRLSFAASC
jgi:Uma2 family endonuclease